MSKRFGSPRVEAGLAWQHITENKNGRAHAIYIEPKNGYFYCLIADLDGRTGDMLTKHSIDIPYHAVAEMNKFLAKQPLDSNTPKPFLDINHEWSIQHWVTHPSFVEIEYNLLYRKSLTGTDGGSWKVKVDGPRWSEESPVFATRWQAEDWIKKQMEDK